jgi:NAD(P)H-dependent FMN reductase
MPVIKVILGSTRPNRFGNQPADLVMELSKQHADATFELVDLAEINLPLLDEPVPASMRAYTKDEPKEHTKAWAKIVGEADGFVFVTGEYNYTIPAALKNAIDFVAHEWYYKPVAFVSYGADAGGARAVEHLRGTAGWLRMYDLREHLHIPNYWTQVNEQGAFQPTDDQIASINELLKSIAFWSARLKPIREELAE